MKYSVDSNDIVRRVDLLLMFSLELCNSLQAVNHDSADIRSSSICVIDTRFLVTVSVVIWGSLLAIFKYYPLFINHKMDD